MKMTKLYKLQKELEQQVRDLILDVLKNFDMSKYDVIVEIENDCLIRIKRKNYYSNNDILSIQYDDENNEDNNKDMIIRVYTDHIFVNRDIKHFSEVLTIEKFFDILNSDDVNIIKFINSQKAEIEKRLKAILLEELK